MDQMKDPASTGEIVATVLARDLVDGDMVNIGANLAVARAGALLAHLTHGPNMTVVMGMSKAALLNEPELPEFELLTDHRASRWAEAYYRHDEHLANIKFRRDSVFFAGAMQVDPFGNSNLIGIGSDYGRLKVRGPGAIGTCNGTALYGRFYIVLNAHSTNTLVEKCDFISAVGFGRGEQTREALKLPGPGPKLCVTPLCVMDFEPSSKRMRLVSVHPGYTVQDVIARTGFELIIPDHVPQTALPGDRELGVLRQRIDVRGNLRKVMLRPAR